MVVHSSADDREKAVAAAATTRSAEVEVADDVEMKCEIKMTNGIDQDDLVDDKTTPKVEATAQ